MAKSLLTKIIELEFVNYLYDVRYELGIVECAIGAKKKYGIVDVLSYQGKRVSHGRGKPRTREVTWRCYEIKISKQDFLSKHKWTFVGDYNYFVVPIDLFETIKDYIPKGIGCYVYVDSIVGFKLVKKAAKQKAKLPESQLMHDYLVSNNRDSRRLLKYNTTGKL